MASVIAIPMLQYYGRLVDEYGTETTFLGCSFVHSWARYLLDLFLN